MKKDPFVFVENKGWLKDINFLFYNWYITEQSMIENIKIIVSEQILILHNTMSFKK